ncbi:S-layer homology domain-containing protein [Cohnella zeiphila]|uniref:S-layer homology domain-containing protein n=1 Tax=Cohnella zeiphila TaxID=2761120 RepID=UPI001EE2A8A3|nr:S-layer homology domain-containing protein [Cohnella zeiphila]
MKNTAPTATDVAIEGTVLVGQTLTGKYTYNDVNQDEEEGSTYKWYRGSNADGSDKQAIENATEQTYKITPDDVEKYLFFEVTPKATSGVKEGTPATSASAGPVAQRESSIQLTANPSQIVGDGKSQTTLTAVVTDENNQPISGVDVVFTAPEGTFVGPSHATTDENGVAKVTYQSAAITGTESKVIAVTATVNNPEKGLNAQKEIQITFLPARIRGVITDGKSNTPVPGATVRVTLDLNGDGKIEAGVDFDETVTTDETGAYSLAVPKGNEEYTLEVTRTVDVGGVPTSITYSQNASVGEVTGTGDESFESVKTATGLVLFQKPDGKTSLLGSELLSKSKVYLKDKDGNYVTEGGVPKAFPLNAQGIFNAAGLAVGEYTMEVRYEVESGQELTVASGPVSVQEDGELNITTQLIDPYGTITDAVTGNVIEGATVTLYYADTKNNRDNGITPNTKVTLPAIAGFAPNDNDSPEQLTDASGFYAYMVYPNTDYYLIVSKNGYQTLTSTTLNVKTDIIKYDAALSPYIVSGSAPVVQDPKVTVSVSADKNLVQEGEQSTVTVNYKNDGSLAINSGKVTVTLPEGVKVVDAAGGTVAGNTITWTTASLPAGQSGSFKIILQWPQLTKAEQEFEIAGQFAADGSSAASATAKASAKINVFSNRFDDLKHQRYILGYPDGTFKRDHSLTRAELAAIVARLTENDTVADPLPFSDVRSGHWATNYIKIAVKHGYFSGFADGTFRPDQQITRGELAAVMARFLGLSTGKPVTNHFTDTKGNWAENAVEALYLGHYLSGYTDGTFKPNQKIRRDEAVTLINRMLYRGPLQGLAPVFPDVPEDNWSFGDVQEATVSHEATRNGDGSETFVQKLEDAIQ